MICPTCNTGTPGACDCMPPAPAEACSHLLEDPAPKPFVFPLEPIFTRYPWLALVTVACVVLIWTGIDGYLKATP